MRASVPHRIGLPVVKLAHQALFQLQAELFTSHRLCGRKQSIYVFGLVGVLSLLVHMPCASSIPVPRPA
jgi:hypothetical protein